MIIGIRISYFIYHWIIWPTGTGWICLDGVRHPVPFWMQIGVGKESLALELAQDGEGGMTTSGTLPPPSPVRRLWGLQYHRSYLENTSHWQSWWPDRWPRHINWHRQKERERERKRERERECVFVLLLKMTSIGSFAYRSQASAAR